MSDTPKLADESKRILDNGWMIHIWKNELGSYTARARRPTYVARNERESNLYEVVETDDFEPSQALYRLTEKVFGNIV